MQPVDLTILLTLRGRHLHTLRWLWHANRTALPFRVLVADGEVHPTIAKLLEDRSTFPALNLEYRRYADHSFSDFYRKCADALRRIDTRYTMMADNDDFLLPSGIGRSIAFLDDTPGYVCAGGGVSAFWIESGRDDVPLLTGRVSRVRYRCNPAYARPDLADPSATRRAMDELTAYRAVYYHVFRTEALRTIADEIAAHDLSDLDVHELFWGVRAATLGSVRCDPSHLSYFRQVGTSSASAYVTDWVDHVVRSRLPADVSALAEAVAREAAAEGLDACAVGEEVRTLYARRLRETLAGTMLRHRFPRLFRAKQALLRVAPTGVTPRARRERSMERELWRRLAADGADGVRVGEQRTEIREVERTLGDGAFLRFVRERAPDLLGPRA